MNVGELMETLKGLDPKMDVLCTVETVERPIKDGQVLDISIASVVEAEKFRADDETPSLRYQRSDLSKPHLILEVTREF